MKIMIAASTAALFALSAPVFANAHTQGLAASGAAKEMKDTIQSLGSGKVPASTSTGGWGNIAGPAAEKGVGQNNVSVGSKK